VLIAGTSPLALRRRVKYPLIASVALILAVALGLALGQELVPVPKLTAPVIDLTGTLTAQQVASLDESLREFERRKGSQIAVLLLPTTKPEAIEQYSIRVAETWKVGRKSIDDGAILIVATQDRALRIEVGYGLEGAIPDAIAHRVVDEVIVPRLRAGDFYGGIRDGTAQLMRLTEGESLPPPQWTRRGVGDGGKDFGSLMILLFVAVIVIGRVLTTVVGRFMGSLGTGSVAGVIAFLIAGSLLVAAVAGLAVAIFTLVFAASGGGLPGGRHRGWGGPWTGGRGGGGGWSSGGGWSGGGGGFGGGGASGRW
jgi:uncharacterized protein